MSESQAVGYIFTELLSLREMLPWVVSDGSTALPGSVEDSETAAQVQARIDAVSAKCVCCEPARYDSSPAKATTAG